MALRIEIKKVEFYEELKSPTATEGEIAVETDHKKEAYICLKNDASTVQQYRLNVLQMYFKKRMYHPTEVMLEIQMLPIQGEFGAEAWNDVPKDDLVNILQGKEVHIYDTTGVEFKDRKPVSVPEKNYVGKDFYVEQVKLTYMAAEMRIELKIYSLDFLLTKELDCRSFTGKRLTAIVSERLALSHVPYDKKKSIAYDTKELKTLAKTISGGKTDEHIFPYLVQYNESIYDMLARTSNRWGEFMFYEDGKLNFGYKDVGEGKGIKLTTTDASGNTNSLFNRLTYTDYADGAKIAKHYNAELAYNGLMYKNDLAVQKSPNKVEGFMFKPGKKGDKVAMKQISAFFKNDKTLPVFAVNQIFDDLWGIGMKQKSVDHDNSDFNKKYFSDDDISKMPEYFSKDGKFRQLFTEHGEETSFKFTSYIGILAKEQAASKDALSVDFDTTFPCLKLGDIITHGGTDYIVVQVTGGPKGVEILTDDLWLIKKNDDPKTYYHVVATPMNSYKTEDETKVDKKFYPTVIAKGHVRYADPQMAMVAFGSGDDPKNKGRVRVNFNWQEKGADPTPWIEYTGNGAGKDGINGKHYKDDVVVVGFYAGNVEAPYIIGAVQGKPDGDIACTSPGGHSFTISDNENGISSFVFGTFLPGLGTLKAFVPGLDTNFAKDWDKNLAFAGGFELTDKYGLYKVSGSTEDREVSINSAWGNVKINAFTGISISAPNGDVKISGKNVTIEAGNNLKLVSGKNVDYSLWHTGKQETTKGSFAQLALDVTTAVTKKLAEKLTNIVDLSIIRSIAEIVFRPMEGSLTVKSNRFLKLEAGNNKAKLPEAAFNKEKKLAMLNAENKSDILAGVGSGNFLTHLWNLNLDQGMVNMLKAVGPAADAMVDTFKTKLKKCIDEKIAYDVALDTLKMYADDGQVPCKKYADLIEEFWKAEAYTAWDEAKLAFNDKYKVVATADMRNLEKLQAAVTLDCVKRVKGLGANFAQEGDLNRVQRIDYRGHVIERRIYWRSKIVERANALRRAICSLISVQEYKRKDVLKFFSVYWVSMPDNFKSSLVTAFSKENCQASPVFTPTAAMKALDKNTVEGLIPIYLVKRHLKRLAVYNLLTDLGFDEASRQKVGNPATAVPEPDVTSLDTNVATSLVNPSYWARYVSSLSGVPPIEKDSKTFGAQIRDSFTGSLNDLKDSIVGFKTMFDEWNSWGEGKDGRILFATDKKTYQMEKNTFTPVTTIKPTLTSLKEDDASLSSGQQKKLQNFVNSLRTSLREDFD